MNSHNSSIDSCPPRKNSCESHVSVYYEQDQQKELWAGPRPPHSCSSDEAGYENPPVEINDEDTISIDLPPLTWHGYENCPKLLTVTNTGRTILINGHWMNIRPYIEGGPLNGTYLFSQIHFHCPSEHEINGRRFPLEMHIVHYKTSYLTQERAMQEKDGTVVLVYLFQLMDTCETVMSEITRLGYQLREVNSRTEIKKIPLDKLITRFFSNYYIYWGSLTTKKNKYLLQWIINCDVLGVTQQEVSDLSHIITSAVGLTVRQTPRLKPEYDAVYHVGEADYSLPPLKTSISEDACTICKHYEGFTFQLEGTSELQLVCDCKSKTHVCESNCQELAGKYICCKCKSVEMSPGSKRFEGREGLLLAKIFHPGQMVPRRRPKLISKVEADDPNSACKSSPKGSNRNIKKKPKTKKTSRTKKIKKKKSRKCKNFSESESEKSSSKSSVSEDKSKDKLDSGAESENYEFKEAVKKDIRFKDGDEVSECVEERKVKKKKKKKKDAAVSENIVSLKKHHSKSSMKATTELALLAPSSSGLISLSPKTSAVNGEGMQKETKKLCSPKPANDTDEREEENKKSDNPKSSVNDTDGAEEKKKLNGPKSSANDVRQETEETKKIDNADINELKITQTCEIIEKPQSAVLANESKSSVDKEKKKTKSSKDGVLKRPADSRSATRSRSKSRTNVEKTKDPEISEKKNLAARKSKSKSPLSETEASPKSKASLKKEGERSECSDSKGVLSEGTKSKMAKSKNVAEPAKSAQEVKCPVTKSTPGIENLKSDIAPSKVMKTKSIRLRKKTTEEGKEKENADSEGQKSKQELDIKTIFEKKPDRRKKAQSRAGDSNDVKVNFLLSPGTSIKSDASFNMITSESDFIEDKKASENSKKGRSLFSDEFTVNTATIVGSEFPRDELKEHPKSCLMMEHIFRREQKEDFGEWSSQEYHVAIVYDQCILQEYRGMFHPQELRLGDYQKLKLLPRYPELENFNFRLQNCFIKKDSLDQICIRVNFLLKDMSVLPTFEKREKKIIETSEKKDKLLFDQQTQCSLKELNLAGTSFPKSMIQNENNKKILNPGPSGILMHEDELKNEEKQKMQLKDKEKQRQRSKTQEEQKEQFKKEGGQKKLSKSEEEQKVQLNKEEGQKKLSKSEEEQKVQLKDKEKQRQRSKTQEEQKEQFKNEEGQKKQSKSEEEQKIQLKNEEKQRTQLKNEELQKKLSKSEEEQKVQLKNEEQQKAQLKDKEKQRQGSKTQEEQKEQLKGEEKQKEQLKNEELQKKLSKSEEQKVQLKNEEKQRLQIKNKEEQKQQSKNEEEQKEQSKNEEEQKEQSKNEGQRQQLESEEKQKQLSKNKSIHWENKKAEPQKHINNLLNNSDVFSQDVSQSSVTEQLSTDSNVKENKIDSNRSEKKLKSLFVKRRKTVYFIYDKVEKDEGTGKKVFVGSFKTKEEVDTLKKQKTLLQESGIVNANEKSEETCEAKGIAAFENKKADLKVLKLGEPLAPKSTSSARNSPSTSQDTSDKNKDVVTLHKYRPKYSEASRLKSDHKSLLPSRVTDSSQRSSESCGRAKVTENRTKVLFSVPKGNAPKSSVHELHEPSGAELQKVNPDPEGGKTERKQKNVVHAKSRHDHSQTEVKILKKPIKTEEDLNSQKSLDKKESQAALILIPVEAGSSSKTEVILIEDFDKFKKDKKKDKNIP